MKTIENNFPFVLDFMWWILLVFIAVSAACIPSVGAVGNKHVNSVGVVMYTYNPLMYMAGSMAQGDDAIANVDGNLNLRIKPLATYMLYDESILFCGLPVDKFKGKTEPFVLTYERTSHRLISGVGCHELVAVYSLKTEKN